MGSNTRELDCFEGPAAQETGSPPEAEAAFPRSLAPDPDPTEALTTRGGGSWKGRVSRLRNPFSVPDHKHFKTCPYSLGTKSSHPSANKFAIPSLHVHRSGKRSAERGRAGPVPSTEDLMRGASAQELLVQCLSSSLLLEKEESKRFEDQLQQWLSEDSGAFTDSASFPLYLPQTLVSLPQTIQLVMKTSTATSPPNERAGERPLSEAVGTSLTERLKHLERLIRSSREQEVASELHLSALLDMVDI